MSKQYTPLKKVHIIEALLTLMLVSIALQSRSNAITPPCLAFPGHRQSEGLYPGTKSIFSPQQILSTPQLSTRRSKNMLLLRRILLEEDAPHCQGLSHKETPPGAAPVYSGWTPNTFVCL